MPAILPDAAASWKPLAAAALTVGSALLVAWIVARIMRTAEERLRERRGAGGLDAAGATRLRFLRRMIFALIVAVGLFFALLQFDQFDRLASAALASGALVTAILGFAAREPLSNLISGITIAITQPVRVGDHVEIGAIRGVIEDLTLTYTWVRTADAGRVVVPNSVLTTEPLRNDSIREHEVATTASVWVRADADETHALEVLAAVPGTGGVAIDEVTPEGIRVRLAGEVVPAGDRADTEARLRAGALRALRAAGIPRAGTEHGG
ncbi:MAG TPA: mechanosensitive ion channel family protein [Solirubrobacteraceae bacterium]|nr:mechanosensitive ion channel family protein [Solirubrobacteraceae bacterium]